MIIKLNDSDCFKHGKDTVTRIKVAGVAYIPHSDETKINCVWLTDNETSIARSISTDGWIAGNEGVTKAMQEHRWLSNHKHYKELF